MNRCLFLMIVILISVVGCSPRDNEGIGSNSPQQTADKFVNEVVYIKEPSTGLCYAYYWGGTFHGGPAIAVVPEDSIPAGRLVTGNISSWP